VPASRAARAAASGSQEKFVFRKEFQGSLANYPSKRL